jgi:hypothetical protein
MKFYLIKNELGEITGCEMTLKRAKAEMHEGGEIEAIEVAVTAENIRRLLSGEGGYADSPSD